MRWVALAGLAVGSLAFSPASWAQSLEDVQESLGVLVTTHQEACTAPDVSAHGSQRCAVAWGGLMDLRARVAMLNTAFMIQDMEDQSPPSAAELAQVRQDVEAYAAQQPAALDDLSYQPPEEELEAEEAAGPDAAADEGETE